MITILPTAPHLRLSYDFAAGLLDYRLTGFLSSAEFRAAYELALAEVARLGVRRWLSDFSQMRAVRQADQQWLTDDFAPRLATRLRGSLYRSAIVVSADPMNQMFAEDVVGRTGTTRFWEFGFFVTRVEALEWLTQAPPGA